MHCRTVMFGKVVTIVVRAFVPIDAKDVSYCLFLNPMVLHIPCLTPFDSHGCMYKGDGCTVVGFDSRWFLWVANRFQCSSYPNSNLCIVEKTSTLGFSSRADNVFYKFALRVNFRVMWCIAIIYPIWF